MLESGLDLADIVLESFQRGNDTVVNDHTVPEQTGSGTTLHHPFDDVATRHCARSGDLEDGPDLGGAEHDFFLVGGELAHEHLLDLIE